MVTCAVPWDASMQQCDHAKNDFLSGELCGFCVSAAPAFQQALVGWRRVNPFHWSFYSATYKRKCWTLPLFSFSLSHPSLHPSSLSWWSLGANRAPHFSLLIRCLIGQCLKAINGEKHFCPVFSIGLQEKCLTKARIHVSQEPVVLFSFSHVTVYSFNSALQNHCGANYLCVWKMSSSYFFFPFIWCLLLAFFCAWVMCEAEKKREREGLQKHVKWPEWLLGTCEESPWSSLGTMAGCL